MNILSLKTISNLCGWRLLATERSKGQIFGFSCLSWVGFTPVSLILPPGYYPQPSDLAFLSVSLFCWLPGVSFWRACAVSNVAGTGTVALLLKSSTVAYRNSRVESEEKTCMGVSLCEIFAICNNPSSQFQFMLESSLYYHWVFSLPL